MPAKLFIRLIAAATLILTVSGCASQINAYQQTNLGTERVLNKNYSLGEKQQVFVGEPLLRVKDYYVTKFTSEHVKSSANFKFEGGIGGPVGEKDKLYEIVGTKQLDGKVYRVVKVPQPNNNSDADIAAFLLIDSDGHPYSRVLSRMPPPYTGYVMVIYNYDITPASLLFTNEAKETVSQESGYTNYELIYNGRDNDSFHITYREFSPDDLARSSFFQTLTYSTAANNFRFKKNLIEVHSVDNEKIVYTVREDGLN